MGSSAARRGGHWDDLHDVDLTASDRNHERSVRQKNAAPTKVRASDQSSPVGPKQRGQVERVAFGPMQIKVIFDVIEMSLHQLFG